MKVVIVNLTGGGLSGGYRKYLHRLMPLLQRDARISALTVFVPPAAAAAIDAGLPVQTWSAGDDRRNFADLKRRVASLRPDVVFVPTARHLDLGSIPVITMVRNMEPLLVPFGGNTWREGVKNVARAWEAKRAATRARRTIAVSHFVRDFLVERWRLDAERIGVVPHGGDPADVGAGFDDSRPFGVDRYVFAAGSIRPARGLEDALHALALLRKTPLRLVIAGAADAGTAGYERFLRHRSTRLGISSSVVWAGQLDDRAMRAAFAGCAAFVMTSRAEACPNVVLEAMSAGCVSASVDQPPMPEFFGESALYYRAGRPQELADRLARLLDGGVEVEQMRTAARRRAAEYTWTATCDRTIRQLEMAAA